MSKKTAQAASEQAAAAAEGNATEQQATEQQAAEESAAADAAAQDAEAAVQQPASTTYVVQWDLEHGGRRYTYPDTIELTDDERAAFGASKVLRKLA